MKATIATALAILSTALSGCAQSPTGTLAQLCSENGWREIGVRRGDVITPDTGKEIIGNNEARAAWCRRSA